MMKKYLLLSAILHIIAILTVVPRLNLPERIENQVAYSQLPKINLSILKIHTTQKNLPQKHIDLQKNKDPYPDKLQIHYTTQQIPTESAHKDSTEESIPSQLEIVPPKILNLPQFEYPFQARIKKIKGSVLLKMTITTNGTPSNIHILKSSGSEILDSSAIEYVKRITFEPAKTYNNTPIETEITYLLHFVLK